MTSSLGRDTFAIGTGSGASHGAAQSSITLAWRRALRTAMAAGKKASSSSPESKPALSKKQQLHVQQAHHTPFPHWPHPTPNEAQSVCDLLASVHGLPERPNQLVDVPGGPAGCGNVPDVLDALVRTILSANTTSKNSTAAKVNPLDLS